MWKTDFTKENRKTNTPQVKSYRLTLFGRKMKQKELKNHELEYRGMSKLIAFSWISGQSRYHSTERYQCFLNFKTSRKLQIENVKNEMKSVVMEKHELEKNRDEYIWRTFLALLDC